MVVEWTTNYSKDRYQDMDLEFAADFPVHDALRSHKLSLILHIKYLQTMDILSNKSESLDKWKKQQYCR